MTFFARGMEQQTKVKLTFYSRKNHQNIARPCAPLHYSEGMEAGDDKDRYYFWDFEAAKGSNFLHLSPSQIVSMEPTEDAFRVEELADSTGRLRSPRRGLGTSSHR